ncbi:hypothetical protein BDQ17DRAFT_1432331 [Cyathus striatus]|nr:hypothetical protein BDQ17DRAFT_1432331 [Cyathus striatus]
MPYFENSHNFTVKQAKMYDANRDVVNTENNDNRKGFWGGVGNSHINTMEYNEQKYTSKGHSHNGIPDANSTSLTPNNVGPAPGSKDTQYSVEHYQKEINDLKSQMDVLKDMVEKGYLDSVETEEKLSKMKKEMLEHIQNFIALGGALSSIN